MSIGELAGRFGVATHVLRHWEGMGVLRPARRVSGRRRFGPDHLAQVALILRAKEAGFSLEQIREILQAANGPARRRILADHVAELDRKIARLQAARRIVEHPMSCPAEDFLRCPRLQEAIREMVLSQEERGEDGRAGQRPREGAGNLPTPGSTTTGPSESDIR